MRLYQKKNQFSVEALEQRILLSAVPMDGAVFEGEDNALEQTTVVLDLGENETVSESGGGEDALFADAVPLDSMENSDGEAVDSQALPPAETSPESTADDVLSAASDFENGVAAPEISGDVGAAGADFEAPYLPGLQLVDTAADDFAGQVVYLDFGGAGSFDYAGPLVVNGAEQSAFFVPGRYAGEGLTETAAIASVVEGVQSIFGKSGLTFVSGTDPPTGEYSTIFVGGDDAAFREYGQFYGLAEAVDTGNSDRSDRAFVFSETIAEATSSPNAFINQLIAVTARETGRLVGYQNTVDARADHSALFSVANQDDLTDLTLTETQRDYLYDGLQAFKTLLDSIEADTALGELLQAVGETVTDFSEDDGLNLAEASQLAFSFLNGVVGELDSLLNPTDGALPTNSEIITALESVSQTIGDLAITIDPTSVFGGRDDSNNELIFGLKLEASQSLADLPLDLGQLANEAGLFSVEDLTVDATGSLLLDMEFGLDLASLGSAAEAFFIRANEARAGITGSASDLNFGINVGFLEASVDGGSVNFEQTVDISLANPDGDAGNRITRSEFESTALENLVDVSVDTASFTATLPVSASLDGLTPVGTPRVELSSDDLLASPPSVSFVDFDGFVDFTSLDASSMVNLLTDLVDLLTRFEESAFLDTQIPFTDLQIGQVVQMGGILNDQVLTHLRDDEGVLGFQSIQEFVPFLEGLLGLNEGDLGWDYLAGTQELVLPFDLSKAFDPLDVDLNLDEDFGPLEVYTSSSNISLSVDASLALEVRIDLSQPQASVTGDQALPSDGVLANDAVFEISLNGGEVIELLVAPDASNASDADPVEALVADINLAIAASALAGRVQASLNPENKLVLTSFTFGPSPSILVRGPAVDAGDDNAADDDLGLAGVLFDDSPLSERVTLSEANLNASLELNTTAEGGPSGISAGATLGFVGVTVGNGEIDFDASVQADLVNGESLVIADVISALIDGDAASALNPDIQYSSSGFLDLSDIEVGGDLLDGPAATASIRIEVDGSAFFGDGGGDPFTVTFDGDFGEVFDFESLSFADVLAAIIDVGNELQDSASESFLSTTIPFLDVSVNELFDMAEPVLDLIERIADSETRSLQQLDLFIREFLITQYDTFRPEFEANGLSLPAIPDQLVSTVDDVILLDLSLVAGITEDLSFALDAGDAIPGLDRLLDLRGQTDLQLGVTSLINLKLGIDVSDPLDPQFHLYDGSGIEGGVFLEADNIEFDGAIGPIGVFVRDGSLSIGDAENPAGINFSLDVADPDPTDGLPGRIALSDLGIDDFTFEVIGSIDADIPLRFPSEAVSDEIGSVSLNALLSDLDSATLSFSSPSGDSLEDIIAGLDFGETFGSGVDLFFIALEELADGDIFGIELPFIGDALADVSTFLLDIRNSLDAAFTNAAEFAEAALETALFDALGPDGANILLPQSGTGTPEASDVDVTLVLDAADLPEEVIIDVRLGNLETLTPDLAFDLGLPGLALELEDEGGSSSLNIEFGWEFDLVFGVSTSDGFFVETSALDELSVDLLVTLPSTDLVGTLGVIQARARDKFPGDPAERSQLDLGFTVDLKDPTGTDTRLTLGEMTQDFDNAFTAELSGAARLNLELEVGFASLSGDPIDALPSFLVDFLLDWDLSYQFDGFSDTNLIGGTPSVEFNNIRLDVGSFFDDFLRPIADTVENYVAPLRPIVDFLTTRVAPLEVGPLKDIFEDPNDNDDIVTFLDIAVLTGRVSSGTSNFIQTLDLVLNIVDSVANGSLPGKGDNLQIPLGNFAFGNLDLRDGNLGSIDPAVDGIFTDDGQTLEEKFNNIVGGAGADIFSATQETAPDGSGKFEFLLFQPENLVNLLMGNPVDFFQFTLPQFGFDFSLSKSVPIFAPPPVNLNFSLGFSAEINLAFGYDSSGIEKFLQPDGKPSDIFGGFYVVSGDAAPPLLELEGFLSGGVGVGVPGVLTVNADVRLIAEADFSLIDPDDGKLYFSTIADLVEREGPEVFKCLFHIEGGISGEFKISLETLFITVFSIGPEFDIVSFTVDPADCFLHQLPDRFERVEDGRFNNDTVGLAADIGTGPGIHLRGTSISSNGDIDWYRFNTQQSEDLRVELDGESHLQIEVQNSDGNIIDASNSGSERKVLNFAGLPEGEYFIKVSSQDDELSEYELNIDPAANSSTRVFYINDSAVTDPTVNSYYTLAPGDNANDGMTPDAPMATLDALLAAYDLEPGDLVLMDSGLYGGNATIAAADSGLTLAGTPRVLYTQLLEDGDIPVEFGRSPADLTGSNFNGAGTQLTTDGISDLRLSGFGFQSDGSGTGLSIQGGGSIEIFDAGFKDIDIGLQVDGTSDLTLRDIQVEATRLGMDITDADNLVANSIHIEGTGSEQGARAVDSSNINFGLLSGTQLDNILTLDTISDFQINQVIGNDVALAVSVVDSLGTTTPAQLNGLRLEAAERGIEVVNSQNIRIQGANFDGDGTETDESGEPLAPRGLLAIKVTDSDDIEILSPRIRDFEAGIQFASGVNGSLDSATLTDLDEALFLNGTDGFEVSGGVWTLSEAGIRLTDAVNTLVDGTEMDFSDGEGARKAIDAGVATLAQAGNNQFQNMTVVAGSVDLNDQEDALVQSNALTDGGIVLTDNLNTEVVENTIEYPEGLGSPGIQVLASAGVIVLDNTVDGAVTGLGVGSGTQDLLAETNDLSRGTFGINLLDASVLGTELTGNLVSGFSDTGIRAPVQALITDNDVSDSGIGIDYDGADIGLTGNQIHNNTIGLTGSGLLGADGPEDVVVNNIFDNVTGVIAKNGVDVQFNRIYDNLLGIAAANNTHIHHNRIFRNTGFGIEVAGDSGVLIDNNTVYSTQDDSIRIVSGSSDTTLRNNIIWNTEGYGIYVADDSQPGFDSDYNNLFTSGNGRIVWYQKPFEDVLDWQIEARQDLNSIGTTVPDPNLDQPLFVDLAGDNYRIQTGATTINSGDPSYAFDDEPGPNGGPNGLRINQGAFGGTAQAAESPASYLRILSPEFYVDYNVDVARRIVWEAFNVSGNVKLEVHEAGVGKVADITTVAVDNLPAEISSQEPRIGSYIWSPQQDGLDTDINRRYFLRLISADDSTIRDDNREPFSVPEQNNDFYLNDDSAAGDTFTTSPGDNRNTGKSPGDPKAILPALLQNYQLGANQTVHADAGYYMHVVDLVISADGTTGNDEAFVIEGSTGGVVFDRANERPGTHSLEILDADFLTLRNLTLEGGEAGLKIHNQSIFFKGENLDVSDHPEFGISIIGGSDNSTLQGVTVSGNGGHGITIDGTVLELTDSTIINNGDYGLDLWQTGDAVITGNYIEGNERGISIFNNVGTVTTIGNADTSLGLGNILTGNTSYGIRASGKVLVAGNTVSNQTSPTSFGIHSNNVDVLNNVVFGNGRGIYIDDPNLVEGNRSYNNREYGIGVSNSATVRHNISYSNQTGLLIFRNSNQVSNNLFYANDREAVRLDGTSSNSLVNNTLYQPVGDGMRLIGSPNTDIRNNIIVVQDGFALRLDLSSQSDLNSNFNLLRAEGDAEVGFWQGFGRESLIDWQNAARQDRQSLDRDPFFVDPTGADGRLGYFSAAENGADDDFHVQSQFGSFHGGSLAVTLNASSGLPVFASATLTVDGNQSPAIDLGDDTSDFANEPADNGNFVNLGVYGNTDQASKSPPEYVLVTNPDGGETWIQEQDFTIRWRSHDFNGDVDILLQRDGEAGPVLTIADDTANDGEFVWTLPNTLPEGDGFRIEVVRQDDPSIAGESFDPFAISPPISFFYVNDDTVIADGFATGVGNDANDGLSPATPKATIQSVLESYALGEGDVILVDAGEYVLTTNIEITAADAGVTIRGFIDPARPDEVTLLDRANTSSDAYVFELNDADGVIFEQLTITGGYYGIFADRDLDSDDLVIQDNTIYGNERYGIYLERGNDRPQILNNTFFGDSDGSDTQDDGAYVTNVAELEFSGNTAYGHRQWGLYGTGLYGAKVEGNTTYDNGSDGIFVRVRNGYTGIVQGNESFNNGDDGIQGSGDSVILSENLVYGHTGSSDAGIWAEDGALARDNLTYGNYYGIVLDDGATAENNRVYDNSQAGIRISDNQREIVRGNQIYSNKIGIDSRQNNDLIENNLIYDNAQTGIRLENGDQAIVRNNMIYQLTGTGIALINDSRFVTLRNNIVRSDDGLALSVSSNSQEGFDSDYNIYRLGADADLLQWGSEVFDDRLDIFFFLDLEANSLLTDPEFIDIDGDDGILGYDSATDTDGGLDDNFRLAPSSPAVDAGDPLSYFLAELQPNGGRVNIGAYGNTIEATNSPVEVVQILTPNGFEKFQVGEDVGVEFRTWGLLDEQVLGLINVGGGTVDRWLAENFNTSGDSTSSRSNAVDVSGVANPAPESVYQTYRYDSNDPLVYAIPLPDGDYTVKLHFNTLEFSEGRDVFDIALNGTTVTSGFDPRVETGERYKAIAKSYQVNLSGGESLEIRLDPITGDANLSAIELLQPNPGGTTAPTVDLEFSDDGAGSFDPLAAGLSLDRFGNGTFTWTPDTETGGNDGFLRAVANTGGNAQGQSRDAFLVTNAGKNYYLNDDDTTGDVFTTAVGENLNSGKSPDDPMASLFALFKAYSIGGGDTVHIDTGTYVLRQNITLTAANAGMTLLGPSTETALLDRANLSSGTAVLELIDADNVTVENLSITGAETGILADRDNDSDGVVLRNNEIFGNDRYGVEIDRGNDNWTLVANEFYGLPEGSNFDQDLGVLGSNHSGTGLRNNVFYNHRSDGLRLSGVRDIHFEGNESRDNRSDGFNISLNGGGISEIRDNLARNNEGNGFRIRGEEALVINNVAHGQNQRSSYNGFDLQSGATARNNLAYDNGRGVRLDATGVFEGNRIYNNQTDGIFASDFATHRIRDNDIYGNQTGISLGRGNDVIENNRIYANSQIGIHLDNSDGTLIRNNTIYQTDGTGVSVTDQSWDVELRNNIVHMDAGTAINVTKNSQRRFDSDYNLFDLGTDADWLNWGSTFFNERPGIFYELGIERHSRTGDARFVDPAGPDGILGFDTDTGTDGGLDDNFRLQSNSPAIDAGDPAAYFLAEPGPNGFRVNIGAYGNTGEATTGAASGVRILNPAPFDKFEQGEVVPIEFFSFGYLDTQTLAQINAAGPTRGQWSYDAFNVGAFSTRSISTNTNINLDDVVDPAPESVYRTYTQAPSGVGNALRYAFPVQDGSYQVRLHFVPTSFSSGSNVFDIEVNDALLEADYDPRAEADRYAAVTETFDVTAADGDGLDLSLINKSGVAELSAIEIIQTGMGGAENPGFTVSFSSDGGTAYNDILTNVPVDSTGRGTVFWTADTVTNGLNGRIRIAPEDGSGETFESTDPFRVDPVSSAFYINDSSNAGDVYTTAIGDNANSGRRPDAPMASLYALLAAHELGTGDTVYIDVGDYTLYRNLQITAAEAGVTILGPEAGTGTATFDRDSFASEAYGFELLNTGDVTLANLELTGGEYGVFADRSTPSANITLRGNTVHGNEIDGVELGSGNDGWLIENNLFHGEGGSQREGVDASQVGDLTVRGNVFRNLNGDGLRISQGSGILVEANESFGNARDGIDIATSGSAEGIVRDNRVYSNNSHGINGSGSGLIIENNVTYGHNERNSHAGIAISRGLARNNEVYGNERGIQLSNDAIAEGNRVYGNAGPGIVTFDRDQETITGNSVYSNRIGIHLADSDDIVTNNLVYANADQGILLEDADRIFLRNNTVFHPVGNALEIRNGTADADIRNNILWIEAGFNVRVTSDSTSGLELDYNLYNRSTDPNARQGDWQGSFVDTLPEWQSTTGLDANSIFADPAFFDKDGADDIFAYVEIGGSLVDGGIDDNFHLLKNSPAIDRGFFLDTPVVDLEGDSRKDDPGTANQGSDRYDPTLQASQLFQTGSGDSQFMRGDDGSYFYGLPFDFSFFGKTYDRLEISSNGYVQFDTFDTSLPDADNDPQALVDSANPTMAVLWDDLTTGGASGNNIYIDESITGQVTIRWQATYKPDDTAVNMALVLFDDGAFRFDYGTGNSNLTPTVGIADGNGRAIFAQYDGVSTLDSVSSIAFPFAPGFDDIGAYEFKGSSLDDTPPVIVGTDPLIIQQGGNLQPTIGEFEVIFSEAIDSIDARSIFSYQLILDVDENGLFEESDQFFTLLPEYENLSDRVTLRVEEGGLPSGNYQLQIFSQNLRDVSGNALDGNEDDSAGGNYLRGFSIFDTVAPTVDFNIDPADRENAGLSALTFVFDETLDAAPTLAELELRNQDSGDLIDPVDLALQWDPESRTATLTFPGFADSLLPPAAYELTVLAAALSDAAGNPLDGNGDGTAGDNAIFGFLVETIQNPVADFAISPTQGDTGTTFTFDGTLSTDPDGVVATYAWDFGDGATATGSTPQHQFDESGTYSVRLTVTDDDGATDTVTNQLSVSNQAPQITFTVTPESGEPDTEFIFDASASVDNDGTIQSYVWEFGDGTTATGVQVSHQYNAIGLFTATLTLSDNEGAVISADKVIAVGNQPPVAVATVDPEDGNSGTTFTFDGTGSSDPDGLIASYVWDFGDGESATGVSVNHSYASGGNYTATLTVTDDEGSIATTDLVVSVSALPDPVASFTVDPESGDTGTTFTFDAGGSSQVDGTLTDFVWDFGDGNTATGESVTHSFDDVGTYSVSLTVTNNEGTEASTSQTVEVVPLALEIVDFVVNDGAAQRSVVDRLELVFNGDVGASVADANLRIFDRVAGAFLDPASFVRTWDAGSLTLALTFPGETGGSLPDGAYTLVVAGESLSTADGKVLDADGDGTPGGTAAFDFHRLFGDVTGTGGVSVFDAIMFRAALGSADGDADYRAEFDEANTLTIDAADRARFEANLGRDLLAQAAYSHTDPPARTIVEVSVNDGAAQRSMVETLEVTFDYALEGVVTVGDLRLFNRTTGARVDAADLDLTWSDDARTAQLDFSGLTNGTLSDGYYTLVIDGDTIEFQGIALDGDGDGSPGGVFTHDFHRIFGDLSGSGAVSVADALQFGAAFGSVDGDAAFEPAFDEAGDLEVDAGDRARFEANLGRDIAAEAIFSYDLPAVRDVSVNGGVAQRSTVESIELTFTLALENDVSVDDFRIFNRTAGARVNAADLSLSWSDEGRIAQLDFSALDNGTLADGFYTLVLDGDALDRAGTALDGDADGTPGGVFTYDFHRLFGDATGTTTVSTIDALHFRQALGSADGDSAYRAYFDHDSNDLIDADDRDAFEARLGSSIEPEAIAPVILTEPPAESSAPIGDSVSLSVDAQSAAPLTYSWYRDDSLITSGASLATLEIEELSPSDLGSYRVEIANRFGVISSLTSELIADP